MIIVNSFKHTHTNIKCSEEQECSFTRNLSKPVIIACEIDTQQEQKTQKKETVST